MCAKRTHSEKDSERTRREANAPRGFEQPWRNTRPRGNPEPDITDLRRSVERLQALVGR
jgi:hypothetical protein